MGLSWMMMGMEGPISNVFLGQRPDQKQEAAAVLIMLSLAWWIESPIVDLLATSTALADSRKNYRMIVKFALILMFVLTVLHVLVPVTPLYDLITHQVLGVEDDVAARARPAMLGLILWSAAIAWRRFRQGILIRHGQTKSMMIGTFVRLFTLAGSGVIYSKLTRLPGATLAACTICTAVIAECAYVHWASGDLVHREFGSHVEEDDSRPSLSMKSLAAFHFPLTLTTCVNLITIPFVAGALSRMPDGVTTKAAFLLALGFSWILRAYTYGLTEAVIALGQKEAQRVFLAKFCFILGVVASLSSFALWLLGMDKRYFFSVNQPAEVVNVASMTFLWMAPLGLITSAQSYYRGILTYRKQTKARVWGSAAYTLVMVIGLSFAVHYWPNPIPATGIATLVGHVAEWLVLLYFFNAGAPETVAK